MAVVGGALLITGPASAKTELVTFLKERHPQLAQRLDDIEEVVARIGHLQAAMLRSGSSPLQASQSARLAAAAGAATANNAAFIDTGVSDTTWQVSTTTGATIDRIRREKQRDALAITKLIAYIEDEGKELEFTAEAGPGDFIYVPPFVPHQEINASRDEPLECVLVRSDGEAVAVVTVAGDIVDGNAGPGTAGGGSGSSSRGRPRRGCT